MKSAYIQLVSSLILFATVWIAIRHISDEHVILGSRDVSDTSGILQVQIRNHLVINYCLQTLPTKVAER